MVHEKTVVNEGTEAQPADESVSAATKAYIAGIHAWQGNRLKEATVDFRRAVALKIEPLLRRGWVQVYVAEIEGLRKHRLRRRLALWRARRDFQEALRRGEDLAAVYEGLGVTYGLVGNEHMARTYLYSALSHDKRLSLALDVLCRLEVSRGHASAVEPILDEAIELQPADLDLRLLRAKARSSQNKLTEAVTDLAFIVERDAGRTDVMMDLAQIQIALGNFSSAEASMKRALAEPAGNRPRPALLTAVMMWADTAEICRTFEGDAAAIFQSAREVQRQARTSDSIEQLEVLRSAFTDSMDRAYQAVTQRFDSVIEAAKAYQRDVLASWCTESSTLSASELADLEQEANALAAHLEEDRAPEYLLSHARFLQMLSKSTRQDAEVLAQTEPVMAYATVGAVEEQVRRAESRYRRRAGLWRAGHLAASALSVTFWFIAAALLISKFLSVLNIGVLDFLESRYSGSWPQLEIPVGLGWILLGLLISRVRQLSDRRTLTSLRVALIDLAGVQANRTVHVLSQGIWWGAASPLPNSGMSLAELMGIMTSAEKPMIIRERAGFHTRRTQGDPNAIAATQLYQVLTADELPRSLRLSSALLLARKGDQRVIPMLQDTVMQAEERREDGAVSVLGHIESGRLVGFLLWSQTRSEESAQLLVKATVEQALLALGQIKDPSATDALLQALETSCKDDEQKAIVMEALRLQATQSSVEALGRLAESAILQGNSRAIYLESLAKTENPQAADALLRLLDDAEQEGMQKDDIIRALALCPHPSVKAPLAEQLRSLDDVKLEELTTWSQFPKSPTGQLAMMELAIEETTEPARRWIAIKTLAKQDVDTAESLALRLWEQSKPSERAIEALATIGTPRTLEELRNVVSATQRRAPDAVLALGRVGQSGWEVLRRIAEDEKVEPLGRALASAELVVRDRPGADLNLIVRILADEEVSLFERSRLVTALWRFALFTSATGSWTALTRIAYDRSVPQILRDQAAGLRESATKPAKLDALHTYLGLLWSIPRARLERLLARADKRDTRV